MINEGDIELSALRLQAYTKYLEVLFNTREGMFYDI